MSTICKECFSEHADAAGHFFDYVEDGPEELECSICLDVLHNPIKITGCGHIFCHGCIKSHLRGKKERLCPYCRGDIPEKQGYSREKKLQAAIEKLTVRCPTGCGETMARSELSDHVLETCSSKMAVATRLFQMLKNGKRKEALAIVQSKDFDPSPGGEQTTTVLHSAASSGCYEVCEKLMERTGVDALRAKDRFQRTPLHWAARNGHLEVVRLFLSYRTGAEILASADRDGRTCIHLACYHNHPAVVEMLVYAPEAPKFPSEARDAQLELPSVSVMTRVTSETTETPEGGALPPRIPNLSVLDIGDNDALTPLLWSACAGHSRCVKVLVRAGSDMNRIDSSGFTCLHWCASRGHTNAAAVILKHLAAAKSTEKNGGLKVADRPKMCSDGNQKPVDLHALDKHQLPAVYWTVRGGHTSTFKLFVKAGAVTSVVDNDGFSLLHWVASRGHTEIAKLLVELPSAMKALAVSDHLGDTPVHTAIRYAESEIASLFIDGIMKFFPSLKERLPVVDAVNRSHHTPLHLAVSRRDIAVTLSLVEAGSEVNRVDGDGRSPLTWACTKSNNSAIARLLIEKGASVNATDNDLRTPLHWSCCNGEDVELVKLLIENGADVEAVDAEMDTSLHLATCRGASGIIEVLVSSGANLETRDRDSRSALLLAACKSDLNASLLLIAAGADLHVVDQDGRNACILASCRNDPRLIRTLVDQGVSMDTKDREGRGSFSWAACCDNTAVMEELFQLTPEDKRQELLHSTDNDGDTALHLACLRGAEAAARQLVALGADPQALDHDNRSPLSLASYRGRLSVVQYLLTEVKVDATVLDRDGRSALHLAAASGCVNDVAVSRMLVEEGCGVNNADNDHRSSLHLASCHGATGVVDLLCSLGADSTLFDVAGYTALHWAAANGHRDTVEVLLRFNAPLRYLCKLARSPLDLALRHGHQSIAQRLQQLMEANPDAEVVEYKPKGRLTRAFQSAKGCFGIRVGG